MAQKWNLQDIRPAEPTKQAAPRPQSRRVGVDISPRQAQPQPQQSRSLDDADIASIEIVDGNSAKRNRVVITVIVTALIIGAGVATNILLGGADITFYPKVKDINLQADYSAYTSPQNKQLGYELLSLTAEGEKQVKASGKENVSLKAEGKIFIYNTVSPLPQKLIKNTRFETKDGLIFRIKDSVEVPGATEDSSGKLIPGSIAADVVASSTGEAYNIAPTRFTVPGLKNTEQYDRVFAESTAAFTGGFEGEKYIIDEKELDTAKQALHMELREKLLADLKEKKPAGFVIFDDAIALTFESQPSTQYGESLATIKEKGILRVPMFKDTEFAKFLSESTIPEYAGEQVHIVDPMTLTFSYKLSTTTISDISQDKSIDFMLKGPARVVWDFDQQKLLTELLGKNRDEALAIFKNYPALSNAESVIRPFWSSSFPNSIDAIQVHTVLEPKKD